jgi:hypothetical protein
MGRIPLRHSDFVIPSCFGIRASSFLRFNHAAANALNLRMMREHMHVPITPAKKCAQNPANDADN